MSFYHGRRSLPGQFRLVLLSVLGAGGLPFSKVLSEAEIQNAFDQEGVSFASDEDGVYTPQLTLWAFLSPSTELCGGHPNDGRQLGFSTHSE